ncbi:hypothetical protein G3O08_07735 [Cryomorpha ignava]|uniref:DUF4350 domain-containing protein n=1 Tax=Cryomorpha ignava TaxID=101383 RepID=A0A7K3WPG8_9FLAO|nr:DUF4350 domain-containing protein [Cryomorpha ignava]NEN23388.1 hypothetical protein [Cryomorpha ignava]
MRRDSSAPLAFGIIAVVVALIALLIYTQEDRYNWNPSFQQDGVNPYDLSLFKKTVAASYLPANFHEIKNLYSDSTFLELQNGLVVSIDPYFEIDSIEISKLLETARNGNQVFISTIKPAKMLEALRPSCVTENFNSANEKRAKTILPSVNGEEKSPGISYMIREDKERFAWTYFDFENCPDEEFEILGSFEAIGENYTNFVKFDYGDGAIYLHTTPLIFTNFHFKNKDVFAHSQNIFDLIPHQKMFYLDPEYSEPDYSKKPPVSESPLRFILSNPPLKWAWYLIIALTIIYVFNAVRRSQKSIPVFTLPENETANYLDVVSRLYQKEGNHKHIIGIQEKLLKRHLRNKYRLHFNNPDQGFYIDAAQRLQMTPEYLKQTLVMLERAKNNSTLSDEEFKNIIDQIKEFYQKCP